MGHPLSEKSILVTGAAGCIGAWVVKGLQDVGAIPVVFDISENRRRLDLVMKNAESVNWIVGDITDFNQVINTVQDYDIYGIIHLAALQVPFAKADPLLGTRVNVLGTQHVLEAARLASVNRIAYASSIAAPAMGENDYLDTLYGAHKICNEQMAKVYWQDWRISSVCIRPGVIYGPGRDQGMSAAPTLALLAAFGGHAYNIPFVGPVSYVHVEDAAQRFIGAISREIEGSLIFDMNGVVADMEKVLSDIEAIFPGNSVTATGASLPFPAETDDGLLDNFLQINSHRSFRQGLDGTIDVFNSAAKRGVLGPEQVAQMIGVGS
ncbi:MAG: NAD(P)-dependent oxidoreductase [Hellea sp.]|nr:NAD(P)-dependent oxidoreductase [Hellea sp.]